MREEIGIPLQPNDQEVNERAIGEARASLSQDDFAAAWDEGRTMPLDAVVALVLGQTMPSSMGNGD
jgi:hypothetical protein